MRSLLRMPLTAHIYMVSERFLGRVILVLVPDAQRSNQNP